MVDLGAIVIELSVAELLTHPTTDDVLCCSTCLLENVTYYRGTAASDAEEQAAQQHAARAVKAGTVQAIVAAMRARSTRPALLIAVEAVENSVRALNNIIFYKAEHNQAARGQPGCDRARSRCDESAPAGGSSADKRPELRGQNVFRSRR